MKDMEGDSNKERQENELEILQAIFIADVEDLRKASAWKVWRPLDIVIKLHPQQSMSENKEINVTADLHIKCSEDYPNVIPSIFIKNGKGLSNAQMQELRKQLMELANSLKGEVMILDLTQHAQKFLHDHNKPVFQSFYEEMVQNKKKQEEQIAEAERKRMESEKKLLEQQQKVIEEEINRKQEELREELRKRRVSSSLSESSNGSFSSDRPERNSRSKSSPSPQKERKCVKNICHHSGVAILSYKSLSKRTVQRGECLSHSPRGSATMIGMDVDSGKTVAIIEWVISHSFKTSKHSSDIHKQIASIEQEFAVISKNSHEGLIPYVGINHEIERDIVFIYLFQEYVKASTLSSYLCQNIPLEPNLLRHYSKLIVEILTFMHDNDVVHRDLRATSVFIDDHGCVKICDFTLDKRLFDLYNSYLLEPVPDTYPPTLGRGSKKGDVYRFGVIALSLSVGELVTDVAPKVPTFLSPDLQDFLKNCLHPNERERWTFSQLLNHPFLKHNPSSLSLIDKQSANDSKNLQLDGGESDTLLQVPNLHIDVGNQSRLYSEFEILMFLGSGGFGDVLKVRNRLDGRVYAIKRISLDPSRQQLNRKIMREVKLLSRLNHENIVRYYNSWIETSQSADNLDVSSTSQSENSVEVKINSFKKVAISNKTFLEDDLEKFAPPQIDNSVEWSVSYEPVVDDISSSSDEDDEEDIYGSSLIQRTDSSESVIFEGASNNNNDEKSKLEKSKNDSVSTCDSAKEIKPKHKCLQFMYIQMEFCEKSTLRMLIDSKLFEDTPLVWRLFREIIEGLVHIHQQGMIHRDLKPVNIFLDSNNHIKIGDFGLATTDIISKASLADNPTNLGANSFYSPNISMEKSQLDLLGNENMTGRVGTALYVAPELLSGNNKISYNQKVDTYSLGIIFFEMCYPAPSTGMERITLLTKLRSADITMPSDAEEIMDSRQMYLIKWLLQHDLSKRPSSEELLASDVLPPPQLEEAELDEMLRHTVSNPQSKSFKRMVGALFRQKTLPAADFTYDLDASKGTGSMKYFNALNSTIESVEKILKKHGAIKITLPTMMPKNYLTERSETNVHLMDHGGGIVTLPSNLRISFARYVARRDITQLKRYAIEKIFLERKVYGCHPREMYQCVYDIVTPVSDTLLPDAEILAVASEILSEFPSLLARGYYVRLNHLNLLKAILLSSGIVEEKHKDILQILSDIKAKSVCKDKLHDELSNIKISEQAISSLFRYIEVEDSLTRVDQMLRAVTKRKSQAAALASQSLHEIQNVVKYTEMLGLKIPIVVAPGFVFGAPLYSGIVFQIVCELNKKDGKGKIDVIAVGGRYDKLISSFRINPSRDNQFAVGFSVDLEKIINCQLDNQEIPSLYDAVLCSVGQKQIIKEKCSVLKNLWACGIYTHVIYDSTLSLEEVGVFCKENNVSLLLILKENDLSNIKVRLYEKDRFTEKKFPLAEIGDYIVKLVSQKSEQIDGQQSIRNELSRTSSSSDTSEKIWTSQTPLIKITFVPIEKSLTLTKKKRLEGIILTNLSQSPCMQLISGKTCVELIVIDLVSPIIKTIASYIEIDSDENAFQDSLGAIIEKHHSYRKYLTKVFDVIYELKFEKNCSVIALFSSIDYVYKLLL